MSKTNQFTVVEISGVWELSFYLLNYGFIDVEKNFSGVPKVWNKNFPTKIDSVNIHWSYSSIKKEKTTNNQPVIKAMQEAKSVLHVHGNIDD